ncbi:hypothetical protein WR25_10283 [Diploscapter pachys]|uniref:Uncharacterized protein n=1 Tax=Diploscapter pachys TaxID=2018661 RepID=A0A2A2M2L7_9BILA|nr:hypothetical protein WR25_10283 [Diploscapter pachys]
MRLQERGHLVRTLRILADRRDAHGAALRQRLQRRQFGDARSAPRRPQIDEHRLALERSEGGGLAVRPLERRARRGLAGMAAVDADLRGRGGRSRRFVGRRCVRIGRVRLPGGGALPIAACGHQRQETDDRDACGHERFQFDVGRQICRRPCCGNARD